MPKWNPTWVATSTEYVRSQILGQSETEMEELDVQMDDDIKNGRIIDPLDQVAMDQNAMDMEQDNAALIKRCGADQRRRTPRAVK